MMTDVLSEAHGPQEGGMALVDFYTYLVFLRFSIGDRFDPLTE